jgi:hypothetical protein
MMLLPYILPDILPVEFEAFKSLPNLSQVCPSKETYTLQNLLFTSQTGKLLKNLEMENMLFNAAP